MDGMKMGFSQGHALRKSGLINLNGHARYLNHSHLQYNDYAHRTASYYISVVDRNDYQLLSHISLSYS